MGNVYNVIIIASILMLRLCCLDVLRDQVDLSLLIGDQVDLSLLIYDQADLSLLIHRDIASPMRTTRVGCQSRGNSIRPLGNSNTTVDPRRNRPISAPLASDTAPAS